MHSLLKLPASVLLLALGGDGRAAELDVTITGVSLKNGTVLVGLFRPGMSFTGKPLAYASAQPNGALAKVEFTPIAPGEYAVSAFQDANGNQRLDRGKFGIPTEKYGFSRDARGNYGPPEFVDALIRVGEKGAAISFTLE